MSAKVRGREGGKSLTFFVWVKNCFLDGFLKLVSVSFMVAIVRYPQGVNLENH